MKIINNKIIFEATGREIYANKGIIGLSPDQNVFGGYDDSFWAWFEDWMEGTEYKEQAFTRQENIELADFMIARWQEFKQRAERG